MTDDLKFKNNKMTAGMGANHMLALRVVIARVYYILSVTFTSPRLKTGPVHFYAVLLSNVKV